MQFILGALAGAFIMAVFAHTQAKRMRAFVTNQFTEYRTGRTALRNSLAEVRRYCQSRDSCLNCSISSLRKDTYCRLAILPGDWSDEQIARMAEVGSLGLEEGI